MGLRVVAASLLLSLLTGMPVAQAQYFQRSPFAQGARNLADRGGETAAPGSFSAYAYPSYRAQAGDAGASFRTLCVRLCDGYYFPISFSAPASGLARDAQQCAASCGEDARLFYHANPGGSVDTMTDLSGRAYKELPTAFRYRASLVRGCSCRPQPQAAAGVHRGESRAAAALPDEPPALAPPEPIRRDFWRLPRGRSEER